MIANISVITDNLDYLLWGRVAQGQPGGVLLTLLMALGAALLALPGGIVFLPAAPGVFRARFATGCLSGRSLFAAFR